jgi:hypothetical protein
MGKKKRGKLFAVTRMLFIISFPLGALLSGLGLLLAHIFDNADIFFLYFSPGIGVCFLYFGIYQWRGDPGLISFRFIIGGGAFLILFVMFIFRQFGML